jgi:predicted RNA methylase
MKYPTMAFLLSFPIVFTASLSSRPINGRNSARIGDNPALPKKKENFHKILERVGKTVFRPGGSRATRVIQDEWCNPDAENPPKVIELAAGVGTAGMEWAARSGCHVTVTDSDASRMEIARKTAAKRGLSGRIETSVQDMFHLNFDDDNDKVFDVAMVEAALTHFPRNKKLAFLTGVKEYANELLLHEIYFRGEASVSTTHAVAAKRDISRAVAIGFNPETEDDWKSVVEEAGWRITHAQTGPMRLLNPAALLEEEGIRGVSKMAWNLATHRDLRERIFATKSVLQSHQDDVGYIILRAVKTMEANNKDTED